MRDDERGQALVEAALFLPLVLLLMFGAIYISQFSVVAARTQLAVRYGANTANTAALYSVANIYSGMGATPTLGTCTAPLVSVLSDGAPLPGPTLAPYWQPASATSSCTTAASKNQGAQFLSLFVASTVQTVSASVNVPNYLQKYAGVTAGSSTSAQQAFARTADPGLILCSSKEVRNRVYAALAASTPSPDPSPAGSPTPIPVDPFCT